MGAETDILLNKILTSLSNNITVITSVSNQPVSISGQPVRISGQWIIVADTGGGDLDLIKQNDLFNAGLHGILILGLDDTSVPNRYRQIKVDNHGMLSVHPVDIAHDIINPSTEDTLASINAITHGSGNIFIKVLTSGQVSIISGQETTITPVMLSANIHNSTITPNIFILSNAIKPSKLVSLFRVQAAMTTPGILRVSTSDGANSGTVIATAFNQNFPLIANSLYIFDHIVHSGESVNYSYSTSSLVTNFHVQEMPGGVY